MIRVRLLKVRLIFFWMMLKLVYILVIVIPKLDNAELPMWDRIKVVMDRWYIYRIKYNLVLAKKVLIMYHIVRISGKPFRNIVKVT